MCISPGSVCMGCKDIFIFSSPCNPQVDDLETLEPPLNRRSIQRFSSQIDRNKILAEYFKEGRINIDTSLVDSLPQGNGLV